MSKQFADGYIDVLGRRLYYKSFGNSEKGSVLCLHGGPGLTHDYILPLADLASFGYRIAFYDQLGCGKSELPKNIGLFTVERAVEEVEGVRQGLSLGRVHLYGSSYGGLLAIAYALKYQKNLLSLITTGALTNVPFCTSEILKMRESLPQDVLRVMEQYEEDGDYTNPEYQKAMQEFYMRFFCRLPEWPKELLYSLEHASPTVAMTMNGPTEFTMVGALRYWNVSDQLPKISVPTLVTCGKYDEVSPKEALRIHKEIRGSKLVVFENSSHLAMWEEREKYVNILRNFLDNVKTSSQR
ncbi:MAG TPA: proline iminopeptidase-family hydrolase [Candidatus Acidoferrales bacterium]|nr:proline iminopeptidase-family hydrolase [Candidatus Acidoferrales bacterium]